MSIPKMRWRKKDIKDFSKMRKNYNAKITRMENNPFYTGPIPERIYKNDITSRSDFNKIKKQVDIFTSRGSEKIVTYKGQKIPFYEKKHVQSMVKSIAAKNAHKRKQLSYEGATMGLNKDAEFMKPNLNKPRTKKEWEKFKKNLEAKYYDKTVRENQAKYKDKYMQMVDQYLGAYGEPIIDLLEDVDPGLMLQGSYNDELMSMQITSDPIQSELLAESIYHSWVYFLGDRQAISDIVGELDYMDYEDHLADTQGPGYHESLNKNIVNWSK